MEESEWLSLAFDLVVDADAVIGGDEGHRYLPLFSEPDPTAHDNGANGCRRSEHVARNHTYVVAFV